MDALIDDFMKGYYGAAAPLVRKYFDELQSLVASPDVHIDIWFPPTVPWLTDDFVDRSIALWNEAEALVKDDPVLRYNVRKSSLPVYYAWYKRLEANEKRDKEQFRAVAAELLKRYSETGPDGVGERPIIVREHGHAEVGNWRRAAGVPEPPQQ